jgi:uncharacterized membrane protein YbhN (UPF0104 family)
MSTATVPRRAVGNRVFRILGSAILLVLLAFLFPRHKVIQALESIPRSTLAAAVPVYLALHFLGCFKWHIMVNGAAVQLPILQSIRCYFSGLFANLFLPSVIGGDVVMMTLGATQTRKTEGIVSGTLASRAIDLAALGLLVAFAIVVFPRRVNTAGETLMQLVLIVMVGGAVLACAIVFALRRRLRGRAAAYWDAFASAWRHPGVTLGALGLSLAMQTGLVALSAWIGAGCGLDLPVRAWLFAWPLAKLSGFVPVTLAGIGSRELVLPALLAPFGADPAVSASVGLAWDAVLIAGCLVAGVIAKAAGLAHRQ